MTWTGHRFLAAIGLAGALALGGCAYDDGYYGGVSVGSGYYGGGYYDDYWGPGYYSPGSYGGWYNGYYYPGSGYYVYDRGGRRHRWNDGQRRYWENYRQARREDGGRRWRDGQQRQWQGDRDANRQGWRARREGNATATPPSRPPVVRNESRSDRSVRDWWPGAQRSGERTNRDGQRGWRN
ncbi:hypothetical protein BV96_00463 [Sphingomonas paucimobilis]|nr:hypothetical protein BV96_00463 [Sphingomonas paucimobilis]